MKLTRTVKGIATRTVASIETRAMNQDCSTNSRPCRTIVGKETKVSSVMATKSPIPLSGASITLAMAPPPVFLHPPVTPN